MGQEKMSNPLPPSAEQVTIGIDISKDRLDVHSHPAGHTRQFANDRAGHACLMTFPRFWGKWFTIGGRAPRRW
jgi:hypothetical protein